MRFFILGANGLLGKHLTAEAKRNALEYIPISRRSMPDIEHQLKNPTRFVEELGAKSEDYIVNALGITRHRIQAGAPGADPNSIERINSKLPFALGESAQEIGFKVLQIGTDCVFSGQTGDYTEDSEYDAEDVYGKSKATGESAPGIEVVRASFIGTAGTNSPYLWDWVQNQKPGSTINGYTNVLWNGVTAEIHARLAVAIAQHRHPISGTQHLVPMNTVSKKKLLKLISTRLGRSDITVQPTVTDNPKNMTLRTNNESVNSELWQLMSFDEAPTIEELILNYSGSI